MDGPARLAARYPAVAAEPGLLVLHRSSGFAGRVMSFGPDRVALRGSTGLEKSFPVRPGDFAVDGRTVHLVAPTAPVIDDGPDLRGGRVRRTARTASGSRKVDGAAARVARASRILVEGKHDAELLEKVWGDDLRVEGIVVEILDGIDHLAAAVGDSFPVRPVAWGYWWTISSRTARRPGSPRRSPILTCASWARRSSTSGKRSGRQAVGIDAWPTVPMGMPWKDGVCTALGVEDPPRFWRRLLGAVSSWSDLDQSLVTSVEQLIDFVTGSGGSP